MAEEDHMEFVVEGDAIDTGRFGQSFYTVQHWTLKKIDHKTCHLSLKFCLAWRKGRPFMAKFVESNCTNGGHINIGNMFAYIRGLVNGPGAADKLHAAHLAKKELAIQHEDTVGSTTGGSAMSDMQTTAPNSPLSARHRQSTPPMQSNMTNRHLS